MNTPAKCPAQSVNNSSKIENLQATDPFTAESLRTLTARERFVAEYNIAPLGEHMVSLVLPIGTSAIRFLERAQEIIAKESPGSSIVQEIQLEFWRTSPSMQISLTEARRVAIDGHVERTAGLTSTERRAVLSELGLTLPTLADLAVCHAAFYMATGKSIFCDHVTDSESGKLFCFNSELIEAVWMGCVASHYPDASAAYLNS